MSVPHLVRSSIAALTLLLLSLAAQASMYNIRIPGAWPGGRITWYYNPVNRPANLTDDEVIAAVSAAFAAWKQVCQVEGVYGGLTSTPVTPTPGNLFVVGYLDFGGGQFHARGTHTSSTSSGNYRPFTGGSIQINSVNTELRGLFDGVLGNNMISLFQHEIGHALGLAHSDDPRSIMFANPYNTAAYEATLQGDDITACASLYGGRGLVTQPDLRNAPITSPLAAAMQSYVHSTQPTSAQPASSVAQIDAASGASYYFSAYWKNLPLGTEFYRRWITPQGNYYQNTTRFTSSSVNGFNYSSYPADYSFRYAGKWALQVVVNGQVATNVPFEVTRGELEPVAPFEMALLGERETASGQIKWRAAPYGRGGTTSTQVLVVNGQPVGTLTAPTQAGSNSVALWLESDRPRYKLDQDDGQPAHSYDVVRQLSFSTAASNGVISAAEPVVVLSGSTAAAGISAQLSLPAARDYNIYAVMLWNGQLLFRGPGGWTTQFATPLVSARGPAVASVDLLRNFDIRALPAGLTLWVGWGTDLLDVLNSGQFALVRQF